MWWQRRVVAWGGAGIATASALLVWLQVQVQGHASLAVDRDTGTRMQQPVAAGTGAPVTADGPRLVTAVGLHTQPASPLAPAGAAVPVHVTAPRQLLVGETGELLISVGPNHGIADIRFTVQFDGQVLQVRAGSEGPWAAMAPPLARTFNADISDAEDRVQIHSSVSRQTIGLAGGGVALLQFQAVAPGSTSVIVSDVVVTDPAGRPLTPVVNAANLQLVVESPPRADTRRQRPPVTAPAAEPMAAPSADSGD